MKAGILKIITPETRLASYIHRGVFPISVEVLKARIIPQKETRGTKEEIKEFILKNFVGYCAYIEQHYGPHQKEKFICNNFQAGGMNVEPTLSKFEGIMDPKLIVDEVHQRDSTKIKLKKLTTQQIEVEAEDEFPSVVVKPSKKKKKAKRLINSIDEESDDYVFKPSAKSAEQEEDDEQLEALFQKFGMQEASSFTPSFLQKNATAIRPHGLALTKEAASNNKKSYIN